MEFELPPHLLNSTARILDAGGWFNPFYGATHVVDLMPYETRRGRLNLKPDRNEHFTKETWTQIDFLDPRLKLPFPDKFFDFSVCGHTVEDLKNPVPLLTELQRVSQAGYIETPSRLSEQTTGSRDRMSRAQGHPHHYWIVDSECNRLLLASKKLSLQGPSRLHAVPLRTYEAMNAHDVDYAIMRFPWQGSFDFTELTEDEAVRRARKLASACHISERDRVLDLTVRQLRRIKRGLLSSGNDDSQNWWKDMLRLSRPYSSIPI